MLGNASALSSIQLQFQKSDIPCISVFGVFLHLGLFLIVHDISKHLIYVYWHLCMYILFISLAICWPSAHSILILLYGYYVIKWILSMLPQPDIPGLNITMISTVTGLGT